MSSVPEFWSLIRPVSTFGAQPAASRPKALSIAADAEFETAEFETINKPQSLSNEAIEQLIFDYVTGRDVTAE